MKRFLPRFFRCLLIAALVAAIAAPLAPTGKALGQVATGDVAVTPSTMRAGAVAEFVITLASPNYAADVDKVTLKFSHASVPSTIDRSNISVSSSTEASLLTVAPTVSGSTISFFTPLEDPARIVISSSAGLRNSNFPTAAAKVTVNGTDSAVYSVTQYLSISPGSAARNATITVTGGGFSAGTSGGISILVATIKEVRGEYTTEEAIDHDGDPNTAEVENFDDSTGDNHARNDEVVVTERPTGAYTVDSQGKLSGSFVVSGGTNVKAPDASGIVATVDLEDQDQPITSGDDAYTDEATIAAEMAAMAGLIRVTNLATGAKVDTASAFSQKASASPSATEVALGSTLRVWLSDFDPGSTFTATIAGVERDFTVNEAQSTGMLTIMQDEGTGTKGVAITGSISAGLEDDTDTADVDESERMITKSSSFLITIVSRTLTVSPSSAVPGQAVTVSGALGNISTVDLTLTGGLDDPRATGIRVITDGSFLYTGRVPFTAETAKAGPKTWTATETAEGGRAASSSGFTIQKRSITLSPSWAKPGWTVEVFGAGWGVKTRGSVSSQVTITMQDADGNAIPNAGFGPFPVSRTGEFHGVITVPPGVDVPRLTVIATDNNGPSADGGTDGFSANQTSRKVLRVATGVVTLTPDVAQPGSVMTVSGTGFPARMTLSALRVGWANLLPVPPPVTDASGSFTGVTLTVPGCYPGASGCGLGAILVTVCVADVMGVAAFTFPEPSISLSTDTARPGEMITITGTAFSLFSLVGTINFGSAPALPVPNPRTDINGDFTASVTVPPLNPGAYTVIVRTGAGFRTATAGIRILSENARPPEEAFQELTSRGLLTLAAAMAPRGLEFGAYVPDLPGDTLALVEPNGVLVLTLAKDARISVGGQPTVAVAANRPTFFALGAEVTVEVVS